MNTTTYGLYLESGPMRRKTMVHVLDLLGCVVMMPSTDEAVEAAPAAIRRYVEFLDAHGEPADPNARFETAIREHVTEGHFLGQGGAHFAWDERTMRAGEVRAAAARFAGLRGEMLDLAAAIPARRLDAKPATGDRALGAILDHVLGAASGYLSSVFGGTPEIGRLRTRVEKGELAVIDGLRAQAPLLAERLEQLAPGGKSRAALKRPEQVTRGVRRLLEHEWEHLEELRRRTA
jgi:hypothetical protein